MWAFKKHHEILSFHFAADPGNAASLWFAKRGLRAMWWEVSEWHRQWGWHREGSRRGGQRASRLARWPGYYPEGQVTLRGSERHFRKATARQRELQTQS